MSNAPQSALERLIRIARGDSGQCRVVANFLLAWWNAAECGALTRTELWAVDSKIAAEHARCFEQLLHRRKYPDSLGYGSEFESIVNRWRPEIK